MKPAEPSGAMRIERERARQVVVLEWTPEHDEGHTGGELALAAIAYVVASYEAGWAPAHEVGAELAAEDFWPWPYDGASVGFKPSGDPIRNLTKAGALIAAEIDRLVRARASEVPAGPDRIPRSEWTDDEFRSVLHMGSGTSIDEAERAIARRRLMEERMDEVGL